jgi:hypothetical protein
MHLLYFDDHGEVCLTTNLTKDIPPYAILSHTWGEDDEEITFKDIATGLSKSKAGYTKIRFCGEQAQKYDIAHFWVDTCCIDKENSVELSEAINSMFRWYHKAVKCYVYLADVTTRKRNDEQVELSWKPAFRNSRWFKRGWTLQELLAPEHVEFFSREGVLLGDKMTLQYDIQEITQIPIAAFCGAVLTGFKEDERMRWAANRETTRPEDKWYCLLGIFGVFMTPIYGEGEHASVRLKDEIGNAFRRQLDANKQNYIVSNSCKLSGHNRKWDPTVLGGILPHNRRQDMMESLIFEQMDSRRSTIKHAQSTTCEWLLRHAMYSNWTNSSNFEKTRCLLWIHGKPGAGKSTLIKFALAHAERNRPEHEILVSFFFNARGDQLEKSTIGMYRALCFQLLDKAPDLQIVLDDRRSFSKDRSLDML